MRQDDKIWCGAKLNCVQLHQVPKYIVQKYIPPDFIPIPHDKVNEGTSFLFSKDVLNSSVKLNEKQKFKCVEDFQKPCNFRKIKDKIVQENEWYRGLKTFNITTNITALTATLFHFITNIITLIRSLNKIPDYFT